MSSPNRRREMDVMRLMMSEYEVTMKDEDDLTDFFVKFHGPKDSPYEGGVWKVHVQLPAGYPYKSPSIGFMNRIFHPNVDESSGSICLDVINQTWTPMFDLLNVFESFLPQLLLYPNASDPLNGEAAALSMRDPEGYKKRIADTVAMYATPEAVALLDGGKAEDADMEDEDDDDDLLDDVDDVDGIELDDL